MSEAANEATRSMPTPVRSAQIVRVLRRLTFASGHRYWFDGLSPEENERIFGKWASRFSHGHNYTLEVVYSGRPDPQSGMVANIKWVDSLVRQRLIVQLDGKSLNDEVPWFRDRAPTLENISRFALQELQDHGPPGAELAAIRLFESPELFVETFDDSGNWIMTLTRCYEFAAGHRLYNDDLSEEKNWELYGKDTFPSGHGHNYKLEVTVEGEPDPSTGMIADLEALDRVVRELVVDRYDHRNLNVDFPEFAGKVTTCENLLQAIWNALDGRLPARLHRVRIAETDRNTFEIGRP